jgi:hypothetical protein
MKTLVSLLFVLALTHVSFAQGQFSQTTTADFKNNNNFNINTSNDELKLTNDIGNGADGNLYIPPAGTAKTDSVKTAVKNNNPSGQNAIQVNSSSGFSIGEEVLIITMQDRNPDSSSNITGQYEFKRISRLFATSLVFTENLKNSYDSSGRKHQVIKVPNYNDVTLDVGGTLTCDDWDGNVGGIIVFRAKGIVNIQALGAVDGSSKGFRGGQSVSGSAGYQGEAASGPGGILYTNNSNGGGGGQMQTTYSAPGGGGGGHATIGVDGITTSNTWGYPIYGGKGGRILGNQFMARLMFGGAGGSGGAMSTYRPAYSGKGGDGGGIVYISCDSIQLLGGIRANGENGADGYESSGAGSGGGAGGAIQIISRGSLTAGNNFITARAGDKGNPGSGPGYGGAGGDGRIRIDAPSVTGSTNPPVGYNGTSYALLGISTTPTITKLPNEFWNALTFTGNTSTPGTSINVDILSGTDSVLLSNVSSGTNLHQAGVLQSIPTIKLRARLINSFGNQTPVLYDWSVKWGPTLVEVTSISSVLPMEYALFQNYPNPFNPTSIIRYDLPKSSFVTLKVYDVLGREVTTLVNERQELGAHQVNWQASCIASGVYFYRLQAGSFVETKKLILLR